jgi:hypothetical protein
LSDVKPQVRGQLIECFFFAGEEVHQERGQSSLLEDAGHKPVAWAEAAAATAVREEDCTHRWAWDPQIAFECNAARPNIEHPSLTDTPLPGRGHELSLRWLV